jgi:hypothetical protein
LVVVWALFSHSSSQKTLWENVCEEIRHVKPKRCILSTDLGRPKFLYPDKGIQIFTKNLLSKGFSPDEIKQMTSENTTLFSRKGMDCAE